MSQSPNPVTKLLKNDPRYRLEAYQFVREALSFAQDVMAIQGDATTDPEDSVEEDEEQERHLTGQQLCEAIRQYAIEQYGYMAADVLKSWGVTRTSDFGEIVYNLIEIGYMKKSESDRREDFDDVYEFDDAFRHQFKIVVSE